MFRNVLIVLMVLLIFNLSGCASFSRPIPKVESIQAGQVVSEKVRQHCSDVIKQCRTDTIDAMQLESAVGGASLGVNMQDNFDNRFIACVRDQEKDCNKAVVDTEPSPPAAGEIKKATSKRRKNK